MAFRYHQVHTTRPFLSPKLFIQNHGGTVVYLIPIIFLNAKLRFLDEHRAEL